MAKRRWDHKKRRFRKVRPRVATRRQETEEVVRDPETKLLLQRGPDHGPEERAQHQGGIVIGAKLAGLAQTAWAVAPGALDLLRHEGGLLVGLEDDRIAAERVRRWMEAAETLRALARRAGCQKRLSGRYDFGLPPGRGEMTKGQLQAFEQLTDLADRMTWARLGPLLDLVLFELMPPLLRRPAEPTAARMAAWAHACMRIQELLEQLASLFGLRLPAAPQ